METPEECLLRRIKSLEDHDAIKLIKSYSESHAIKFAIYLIMTYKEHWKFESPDDFNKVYNEWKP